MTVEATGHDPAPPSELLTRDFDRGSLVALRHEVQAAAERQGLAGRTMYRFVVAVNEITTNAVRHGGGGGRLRLWRAGGRLLCRVSDRGPGMPDAALDAAPGWPPAYAANGRGLLLAREGAGLEVAASGDGTVVTLTGPPVDR